MAIETPTKVADAATTPVPTKSTDATNTTESTTTTMADANKPSSTDAGSSAAEHQLKEAIRLKDEGNALYGKGDVQGAKNRWHHAHLYSSGISTFKHHLSGNNAGAAGAATAAMAGGVGGDGVGGQPPKSELDKTAEQITLAVMNNLGSCYLAEKNYEKVLYATTKALRVEPNNIKANYRRGRAYFELGDLQQAKDCVDLAIEKGGGNDGAVKGLAAEINKKAAEKEAKAKSEWKGFLNKKDGAAGGGGAGGGGSPAKDVKGKGKAKEENGGGGGK